MDFETAGCIDSEGDTCTVSEGSPSVQCTTSGCPIEGSESAKITTTGETIHDQDTANIATGNATLDFRFRKESGTGSQVTVIGMTKQMNASDNPEYECRFQYGATSEVGRAQANSGATSANCVMADQQTHYVRLTYDIDADDCRMLVWLNGTTWGSGAADCDQTADGNSSTGEVGGWAINDGGQTPDLIFDDIAFCKVDAGTSTDHCE